MKFVIVIASLSFCSSSFAINYFRCETNHDCIKAYGGCGRYLSVHKRYKELYEAKAHLSDRKAFCRPPSERDKQYKFAATPLCKKMSCRLVLAESSGTKKSQK